MRILLFILLITITSSCGNKQDKSPTSAPTKIISDDYELIIPKKQEGLLILFPCYPCDAENTRTEFNIIDEAVAHNITVLLMNFNMHLWLTDTEKSDLEKILSTAVSENNINSNNTYLGGFSSGGNVSLLLTDHLISTRSIIQPKGFFIVDSPIDLLALYENAQKTIERDFSEIAIQEANWIVQTLESDFGVGDTALTHYNNMSPYVSKTQSTNNISNLSGLNIRLYTEPDTVWHKENRKTEYENLNAFYIEQMANDLSKLYGEDKVDYITTTNRGYRANGDRHPHSWAIVDEKDLVEWIRAK